MLLPRLVGESWKDSFTIGTLMNTRGLMELVALNIGYEMGVLPPSIFVILVIMALVTTFMTTPLLHLVERVFARREERLPTKLKLVFCFGILSRDAACFPSFLIVRKEDESCPGRCCPFYSGYGSEPLNAEQYARDSFSSWTKKLPNWDLALRIVTG